MCTDETRQQHLMLRVVSQAEKPISLTEAWAKMTKMSIEEYGSELPATTPYAPARLFKRAASDGFLSKVGPHRWSILPRGEQRIRDIEEFFLEPIPA